MCEDDTEDATINPTPSTHLIVLKRLPPNIEVILFLVIFRLLLQLENESIRLVGRRFLGRGRDTKVLLRLVIVVVIGSRRRLQASTEWTTFGADL